MSREVVRQLTEHAHGAVRSRGQAVLAIPGGSVATAVLPLLRVAELPWSHLHVFWVDERVVPMASAESNAGQALSMIAGSRMAEQAHLYPMTTWVLDGDTNRMPHEGLIEQAADTYGRTLEQVAGSPPILDVALLGVGDDGHVASLFPGHTTMNPTSHAVVVEQHAPKPPAVRLSLSADVLVRARHVIVASFGRSKADALRWALEPSEPQSAHAAALTPLARIIRQVRQITVILDTAAASGLTVTPQDVIR